MEHPTEQNDDQAPTATSTHDALMHAMASAEQVVSQLPTAPHDVTLQEREGRYGIHLFYSQQPDRVAEFAAVLGTTLEDIPNTYSGGTFTQATAQVEGTEVRAWTLVPEQNQDEAATKGAA